MPVELESESGKILQMKPEVKERDTSEDFTSQMDQWVLHELPKINSRINSRPKQYRLRAVSVSHLSCSSHVEYVESLLIHLYL